MPAAAMPLAFVLIWSTGFIVARLIAPWADPNLFLAVRFALTAVLMIGAAVLAGQAWPRGAALMRLLAGGVLLQGLYLGASFWAVGQGLSPGIMALIGALQPPLTAVLARRWFGDRAGWQVWAGMLLGLAGMAMAVWPTLWPADARAVSPAVLAAAALATISFTLGTLMQKSSVSRVPLVMAVGVQNLGALGCALVLAGLLGEQRWTWSLPLAGGLTWGVLVLSVGANSLLLAMVRAGSATRAASLLFLVPPLAACQAWWLFDAALGVGQMAGFGLALVGVFLARRRSSG